MTFVLPNSYSPIQKIKSASCLSFKGSTLEYEIGKNSASFLFVRIVGSSRGGKTSPGRWFAICDLAQIFAFGKRVVASSFESFDKEGNLLPKPKKGNSNPSAFLRAVLHDILCDKQLPA